MKAYLKKDPTRIGRIFTVYTTDFGQKRLVIWFENSEGYETGSIDAGADEFEVIHTEEDNDAV